MNAYDFDKTIYENDSTVDFYRYCIRHNKKVLLALPKTGLYGLAYLTGFCDKTTFKQAFFGFLKYLDNPSSTVDAFWRCHTHKIKACYLKRKRPDDVIISASPEFLLRPVCGETVLIGSRVDARTGKFSGKNCYGQEKVLRLLERFPGCTPEEFYSDSLSDTPLAQISQRSYIVLGEKLIPWAEFRKGKA
ncbi:MAG TPA: phosphoserine phosphatase [Clostridiales bacterium]|nr:phosphoserine phosphatase [Clostridiales bacterium]